MGGLVVVDRLLGLFYRKINYKAGETAGVAFNVNIAAMLLDDTVTHGQTQSGSLTDVLGGEKGIKHTTDIRRVDAGAVIFE
jgi:hypothetical protein